MPCVPPGVTDSAVIFWLEAMPYFVLIAASIGFFIWADSAMKSWKAARIGIAQANADGLAAQARLEQARADRIANELKAALTAHQQMKEQEKG